MQETTEIANQPPVTEGNPVPVQPHRAKDHPENSIKKMAVLFTDVVGSTLYFKSHGDVAGRRMLREHENIATPPILEHGGVVVKKLGDSVMSYFFHALEAVKAAIKIQQRFQGFNHDREPRDQIHVRIGVHFGDGILEEEDIFGDVVNMAAKFLPLVGGDEVCVSMAVCDQVQDLSHIQLEGVSLPKKEIFPKDFGLYRVVWDRDVNLEPIMKTLLILRPLFRIGKANFRRAWEGLIKEKNRIWLSAIEKEEVHQDRSSAIILKEPALSLSMARRVLEFLRTNLGLQGNLSLPIQILIDVGPFVRGNSIVLEDLKIDWEDVEPGRIHISAPAYHTLKGRCSVGPVSPAPGKHAQPLFQVDLSEEAGREPQIFLYQNALVQGDLSPCFYCGDRRHPAVHCPSKRLTEMTSALSRIGYLGIDKINKLFFTYLNGNSSEIETQLGDGSDFNDPSRWACLSFHELKHFYQLRFFRTLWNTREDDWNKVKEKKDDRNHGGLVWIALDCIRVSNLDQAESILHDSIAKEPEDYKPYCAMGFLHIEKNDHPQAKFYWRKALDKAQSAPQKTFILLLLSRIYHLQGDEARAEEMVRKVLRLTPQCVEAAYEDVLIHFRKGKEAVALHQLMKLMKKSRDFFISALIDPELNRFSDIIHPKLKMLTDEARDEANKLTREAREELTGLKRWLGEDEKETQDAETLLSRIEEISKTDGYYSYLDIIHYATTLLTIARGSLEERRKQAARSLKELSERHTRCSLYVKSFPYRFLIAGLDQELQSLHGRINRNWGMEGYDPPTQFKEVLKEGQKISAELDGIQFRLQRVERLRRLLVFLTRFLKKTLIFQSANLVIAVILFPIVVYYLNFLIPGFNIPPQNIWHYQKAAFTLGGICGLLLAALMSGKPSAQGRPSHP